MGVVVPMLMGPVVCAAVAGNEPVAGPAREAAMPLDGLVAAMVISGMAPGNAVITPSGSDIGPVAVQVDRTQDHAGVEFVNGQFMATLVVGEKNKGPVKLTNCGFGGVPQTKEQVIKHGPSSLILNACHRAACGAAGGSIWSGGRTVRGHVPAECTAKDCTVRRFSSFGFSGRVGDEGIVFCG
jgi:hypothetical protein